jgi:hypothetical protein
MKRHSDLRLNLFAGGLANQFQSAPDRFCPREKRVCPREKCRRSIFDPAHLHDGEHAPTLGVGVAFAPNDVGRMEWPGRLRKLSKCRWAWKSTCTPAQRANSLETICPARSGIPASSRGSALPTDAQAISERTSVNAQGGRLLLTPGRKIPSEETFIRKCPGRGRRAALCESQTEQLRNTPGTHD